MSTSTLPTLVAEPAKGEVQSFEPLYSDHRFTKQLFKASLPQIVADCVAIQSSLWLGYMVMGAFEARTANHFFVFACICQIVHLGVNLTIGMYPGIGLHPAKELQYLFRALNLSNLLIAVGLLIMSRWFSPYFLAVAASYPLQLVIVPPLRGLAKSFAMRMKLCVPFYYFGELDRVFDAHRELNRFGWARMRATGRLHPPQESWDEVVTSNSVANTTSLDTFRNQVKRFDSPEELVAAARKEGVFLLVVAAPIEQDLSAGPWPELQSVFPQLLFVNPTPSSIKIGASIVSWGICDGLKIEDALLMPGRRSVKRLLDVLVTTAALFVLGPVLLLIAFLVWATSAGPIVFGHTRIGYKGKLFKAWKFRTMVENADEVLKEYLAAHPELRHEWELNQKLKDDPRITRLGKILRKTSLDELPQLFNVLFGEMSLVGPRPIVNAEIVKYGSSFATYLRVVPGITGLWQISGRNNTTYAERLKYDSYYVHNWSPWLDYYILLRTFKTVLKCEGAY